MDSEVSGTSNPANDQYLKSFENEFGGRKVFVSEEIRDRVGDTAVAKPSNTEDFFAVEVCGPEDAIEVLDRYDGVYEQDIKQNFRDSVRSNQIVTPYLRDFQHNCVADELPMALFSTGSSIAAADISEFMDEILEADERRGLDEEERHFELLAAPSDWPEKYVATIELPQDYDTASAYIEDGSLVVEVDDRRYERPLDEHGSVEAEENNGFYNLRVK